MDAQAIFLNGPISYGVMSRIQDELLDRRINHTIPDVVFFLEHLPVVTLGRRGRDNFLKLSPQEYLERGIELHQASRGGDATFHGPGQLVMYPILQLGEKEADSHGYLFNMEEIAIRTANDFGVQAYRRTGKNGAWTHSGKFAAIGFRLKRWVTSHGMSFNVCPDLTGFNTIVPCGLVGESVTSLKELLLDKTPSVSMVRERMATHFEALCARPLTTRTLDLPSDENQATLLEHVLNAIQL